MLRALVRSALCDQCGKEIHFVDGERVTAAELDAMRDVHLCYERERHWVEAICERLEEWHHTEWSGDRHQRLYRRSLSAGGRTDSLTLEGPSALPLPWDDGTI